MRSVPVGIVVTVVAVLFVSVPDVRAQAPLIPKYPDSAKGLTALAEDIVTAIKKGDAATTKAYMNAFVLPDPNSWFPEVFEKDLGQQSAAEYAEIAPTLPAALDEAFRHVSAPDATAIAGHRFDGVCDPDMNGNVIVLLSMRRRAKPLYEIHFRAGDVDREIWAFAYANGGFRYIGNTSVGFGRRLKDTAVADVPGQPNSGDSGHPRRQVGGTVQAAKMISQAQPQYPIAAKENHVQGTVVLHAIIGTDESVQRLQVTKGPCVLDESAVRAVRQSRYSPTKFNGEPIEVDTTISVIFTLSP